MEQAKVLVAGNRTKGGKSGVQNDSFNGLGLIIKKATGLEHHTSVISVVVMCRLRQRHECSIQSSL